MTLLLNDQTSRTRTIKFFLTLVFSTSLPPTAMYARLRERCAWKWIDRDGDRWGDYVSTSSIPGFSGASLALYHDEPGPGHCTLNVRYRSDSPDAAGHFQKLRNFLQATLLTSIEAHAVNEAEILE
jgi:hypothetical protein